MFEKLWPLDRHTEHSSIFETLAKRARSDHFAASAKTKRHTRLAILRKWMHMSCMWDHAWNLGSRLFGQCPRRTSWTSDRRKAINKTVMAVGLDVYKLNMSWPVDDETCQVGFKIVWHFFKDNSIDRSLLCAHVLVQACDSFFGAITTNVNSETYLILDTCTWQSSLWTFSSNTNKWHIHIRHSNTNMRTA